MVSFQLIGPNGGGPHGVDIELFKFVRDHSQPVTQRLGIRVFIDKNPGTPGFTPHFG